MRTIIVLAASALALAACNKSSGGAGASGEAAPAAGAPIAGLPAPYNTGDLDHGEELFAQCRSCHTIAKDGANMTGPNLYGIFGRHTAAKTDFVYSDALQGANFTWDAAHLDAWLSGPQTYLPGTKMTFLGFPAQKDRVDLIAYLKTETSKP